MDNLDISIDVCCELCGYIVDEDKVDYDGTTGLAQCPRCEATMHEFEISHYKCELDHVFSIMVLHDSNFEYVPDIVDCLICNKDAGLVEYPDDLYYCGNEDCEKYQEIAGEERCFGEDPTNKQKNHEKECVVKPLPVIEFPNYIDTGDEDGTGGSTKAERVFTYALRQYNRPDHSGHGKGKKISSGHSSDRHAHGQKRKTDRLKALALRVIAAFDKLDEDSSLKSKFSSTVSNLESKYT